VNPEYVAPSLQEAAVPFISGQLQAEYAAARALQTGRAYRPRSVDVDLWERIARLCQELEAEPSEFVRIAFQEPIQVAGGPFPNQLSGPAMRRKYEQHQREHARSHGPHADRLRYAHLAWLRQKQLGLERGRRWLLSPFEEHSYPAWTRLVLAGADAQVQSVWLAKARLEVAANPGLRRWLAQQFPKTFQQLTT
jgi:hypothetical protein